MFDWLDDVLKKVRSISGSIDKYKEDTIIQSLPSVTYVNRAKKLLEHKKYEEAKEILQKALNLPQKDALVYKYLGVAFERLGDHKQAVENFQQSADIEPQDKTIWQQLGFALISVGKFEQAVKSFDNANKIQPDNTDTYTGWGMAYMKQKKYAEAREKFAMASKLNKYNFSAIFLCAVMEIKLEIYDKAEMKLTFLANVCPNENNTFEFARLKALKNDYDSAIHYAKKSLEFNDKMMPAYILLGQIYANRHDMENSLKSFQSAEDKGLVNSSLYLEWGKVLEKMEKYDDAKQKLLQAFEKDSQSIDVMANLGLCCVARKEYGEAEPLLEQVSQKEPENLVVKQALGIIAYENGDNDRAISLFRSDDENALNCSYIAKCYERKDDDTKVKDYYNASIRLNPASVNTYTDYANYLIKKSDYADAQRKLRKALKIDDNNIGVLNLLFYVSYRLVKDNVCEYNVKETVAIAQKIESINPDLFEYKTEKVELEQLLKDCSEREKH